MRDDRPRDDDRRQVEQFVAAFEARIQHQQAEDHGRETLWTEPGGGRPLAPVQFAAEEGNEQGCRPHGDQLEEVEPFTALQALLLALLQDFRNQPGIIEKPGGEPKGVNGRVDRAEG